MKELVNKTGLLLDSMLVEEDGQMKSVNDSELRPYVPQENKWNMNTAGR